MKNSQISPNHELNTIQSERNLAYVTEYYEMRSKWSGMFVGMICLILRERMAQIGGRFWRNGIGRSWRWLSPNCSPSKRNSTSGPRKRVGVNAAMLLSADWQRIKKSQTSESLAERIIRAAAALAEVDHAGRFRIAVGETGDRRSRGVVAVVEVNFAGAFIEDNLISRDP